MLCGVKFMKIEKSDIEVSDSVGEIDKISMTVYILLKIINWLKKKLKKYEFLLIK